MRLCEGEFIEITLKSYRTMFTVRGTVKGVSPNGILLSDGIAEYFIRSSEIKMIKRLKDNVRAGGST
jgi:hypothetical protein